MKPKKKQEKRFVLSKERIRQIPRKNPLEHHQISTPGGQIRFVEELFKKQGLVFDPKVDMAREKVWMRPEVKPFFVKESNKAIFTGIPNAKVLPGIFESMEVVNLVSFVKKSRGITEDSKAKEATKELLNIIWKRVKQISKSNLTIDSKILKRKFSEEYKTYIVNAKDSFAHTVYAISMQCELMGMELGIKFE